MKSSALALLALAAACRSPQADLRVVLAGDGGTCDLVRPEGADAVAADGGAADGASADAGGSASQLHCVNFLQFRVQDGSSFSTYCIRLEKRLETLCDLARIADGRELFRLDPNASVTLSVQGLRVFPATSCDRDAVCPAREIFSGNTGAVRIKDAVGTSIDLPVAMTAPCGPAEVYYPKLSGTTCESICKAVPAKVVCDLPDGCLCGPE